jgi:O-acetylhomoserine/O-acetylserine sulfhydrylase-like pyridoxal-dependent enzyme
MAVGVLPDLVRMSVGIEPIDVILWGIDPVLERSKP